MNLYALLKSLPLVGTAALDWVEQGVAPEGVVTTQQRDGQDVRTRPVFPYPTVARYDGSGSIDAANFVPAPPSTPAPRPPAPSPRQESSRPHRRARRSAHSSSATGPWR